PWPYDTIDAVVARYPNATEIFWLQEEPENMGPWNFVKGRLYERFEQSHRIQRVSRFESGSPATGSVGIPARDQAELIERALAAGWETASSACSRRRGVRASHPLHRDRR